MLFDQLNLDPRILKALSLRGYTKPTEVQAKCIPLILDGKDVVASAQTGTGKTAAFVLPALQRLCEGNKQKNPRVLILAPTRELARQVTDAIRQYGKFLKVNVVNLVGGMPYDPQIRDLKRQTDIIVATPGRLMDHLRQKRLTLSHVEMFILDEADRMLDMGFIEDVENIARETAFNKQTLLFSATIQNNLKAVIRDLMKDPERVNLSPKQVAPNQITQRLYFTHNTNHKNQILHHLLSNENIYKAIIYSATKVNADQLAEKLCELGWKAGVLHGDLKQSKRNRTLQDLRTGKIQYLVATDVAARGIDISDITHVINYDLPRFHEDYVHRIGRTGRAGREGIAISFVSKMDMQHLQRIEKFTNQKLIREEIEGMPFTKEGKKDKRDFIDKDRKPRREFSKSSDSRSRSDSRRSAYKSRDEFEEESDRKPRREFRKDSPSRSRDDFKKDSDRKPRGGFRKSSDSESREGFKKSSDRKPRKEFRKDSDRRSREDVRTSPDEKPKRDFRKSSDSKPKRDFRKSSEGKPKREFTKRSESKSRADFGGESRAERSKNRIDEKFTQPRTKSTVPVSYKKSEKSRTEGSSRAKRSSYKTKDGAKKESRNFSRKKSADKKSGYR